MNEKMDYKAALSSVDLQVSLSSLPILPASIRYEDDYADKIRTISDPEGNNVWTIEADGTCSEIIWSQVDFSLRRFLKCWMCWHLQTFDTTTSKMRSRILSDNLKEIAWIVPGFCLPPHEAEKFWDNFIVPSIGDEIILATLKSVLRFMCEHEIAQWTISHKSQVAAWRYAGNRDKGARVRTGEAILSSNEEAQIVDYFDSLSADVGRPGREIGDESLRRACLLYWSFQHGFRPIQIASLNIEDVRVRRSEIDNSSIVHVRFHRAKQRLAQDALPMLRKVKRDWSNIMVKFLERRMANPARFVTESDRPHSLFGLPPSLVGLEIRSTSKSITGYSRTPNDFRHSAAQRLVDSGATEVELAEFLGHKHIDTGLVYFDSSPTQADRVNKALGLSPIFSEIASIVAKRSIQEEELSSYPADNQIGAAPHGFPIIGIGACQVGQSACSKNPALSCYTCPSFLPLSDTEIHRLTRDSLRDVIGHFSSSSRGDGANPTFLQLRRTLDAIEGLLLELSPGEEE